MNDGIEPELCSLSYSPVDVAAKALGKEVDLESAYRQVPVHPDDRWLLGICWRGKLYVDLALPFGLRSALKI